LEELEEFGNHQGHILSDFRYNDVLMLDHHIFLEEGRRPTRLQPLCLCGLGFLKRREQTMGVKNEIRHRANQTRKMVGGLGVLSC
jgi:hypothetical protein